MRLSLDLGTKRLAFTAVSPVLGGDGTRRAPYNTVEWCEPAVLGFEAAVPLGGRDVVPELLTGREVRVRLQAEDAPAKLQVGSLAIWPRPLRDVVGRPDRARVAVDALVRGVIGPARERLRSAGTVFVAVGSEYFSVLRESFSVRTGDGQPPVSVLPTAIAVAGRVSGEKPVRRIVVDWGGGALRIAELECRQVGPRRCLVRVLQDEIFPHLGTTALEAKIAVELFSSEISTLRSWEMAERLESLWFPESPVGSEQTNYVSQSAAPMIDSFRNRALACLRAFRNRLAPLPDSGAEVFVTGSGAAMLDDAALRAVAPAVGRLERLDFTYGTARALASLHANPATIACQVDGALTVRLIGRAPVTVFGSDELQAFTSEGEERWFPLAPDESGDAAIQGALEWGAGVNSSGALLAEVALENEGDRTKAERWLGIRCHRSGTLLYGSWMVSNHPAVPGEEHAWTFDSASHREWTCLPATEGVLT